jgi:hypothetical protein
MAEFLTTLGTSHRIEEIIRSARQRLTLISPFLKLSPLLLERLKDADRRGVQISIVYGKSELAAEEQRKLQELSNLTLYYLKHLHAKCYLNERHVIISSMNMYEFSEKNNREMSVLLGEEDAEAIAQVRSEVQSILNAAEVQRKGGVGAVLRAVFGRKETSGRSSTEPKKKTRDGYCIRCGDDVRYRPESPLCDPCYRSWAAWGNEDYPENECHRCGEEAKTSKAKPLCYDCYREEPFTTASFRRNSL